MICNQSKAASSIVHFHQKSMEYCRKTCIYHYQKKFPPCVSLQSICQIKFVQIVCILQVSSLADDLPVVTESNVVMINGQANRLLLTKGILDFCEALPIYNTQHTKIDVDPSNVNETISKQTSFDMFPTPVEQKTFNRCSTKQRAYNFSL